jgi:hypothetical protein
VTKDQQIRKALELLAPPPDDRAECEHDIRLALYLVEQRATAARSFRMFRSKKGKAGLSRYHGALRRLRNAYNSLDPAISPWFSLAEAAHVPGKPTIVDREIARTETLLNCPSRLPRREANRADAAVSAASDLLHWWLHKVAASRRGKWDKLAKILAGGSADLFDHLRKFKRSPGPSLEKVWRARSILYRTRTRRRFPGIK